MRKGKNEDEINLTKKKRKRKENEITFNFSRDLLVNSFIDLGTDNTFCVFKAINNIFFLVYSNINKSIIAYNIGNNKNTLEIKNAHNKYITSIEHCFEDNDKIKRDLIMSMSAKENNIKIWDFTDGCKLLFELGKTNKKLYNVGALLNDNGNIFIVKGGNKNDYISVYDLNGEKIKDITNSNIIINFLYVYKQNIKSLNKTKNVGNINNNKIYIIAINNDKLLSYDYYLNSLYKIYSSKDKQRINSICFNENEEENKTKIISICCGGYILIWDFVTAQLIEQIRPYTTDLIGICLLDDENICFGHKKNIKIINLKNKKISNLQPAHNKCIVSIQKFNIPMYGQCLFSQGDNESNIKLWIKNN